MNSELRLFFTELIEYNHHFNVKWIEEFERHPEFVSEKSQLWLSHLLNAQHIWNHRIEGKTPRFSVWQNHEVNKFLEIENENFGSTRKLLSDFSPSAMVMYTNSKGESYSNSQRDILFHVMNHCNYHRAQIASDWKAMGGVPLTTDYIFYKR